MDVFLQQLVNGLVLGSIYALGGIDANAQLPHPMGTEAHVLPTKAEGAKSGGLLTEIM